jgi:GNAT superfamily N-acetyltransferase
MDKPYTMTIEETPDPADARFVFERLREFNRSRTGIDDGHRRLAILVRDEAGAIVGGLLGDTFWGWLYVSILWIDESLRGQGYGHRLLVAAEQEAIARGCHHALLDTMSFQARPFYEKYGYTVFGELHDIPVGHSRYYMQKPLQP